MYIEPYEEILVKPGLKFYSLVKEVIQLHKACEVGDLPKVKKLINAGVWLMQTRRGNTPLGSAASCGQYEVVKYLVENGSKLTVDTYNALLDIEGGQRHKTIKYLIEKGSDITLDDNLLLRHSKTHYDRQTTEFLYDLVLTEMKKYTLFLLLNKKHTGIMKVNGMEICTIHKDLTKLTIKAKYVKHYEYYQREKMK